MRSFFAALAGLSLAALLGCSSSPPVETFSGARSATFSAYCTGTLAQGRALLTLRGGQSWAPDASLEAPAGTPVLLSAELTDSLSAPWVAYALEDDGTPHQVQADGLVAGQDFTTDCGSQLAAGGSAEPVLLADTKLYPQVAYDGFLSGDACTVPAGTKLAVLTVVDGTTATSPVTLDSPSIAAECGTSSLYAGSLALGQLVPR